MTVAELLDRMSSREFSEWMAYYELEPWGEERADLRQAMTTSAVHNSIQAQTKHPKWTTPEQFMPFSEKAQTPTAEDGAPAPPEVLKDKLMAFAGKRRAAS
jgi:hypothetical protein